MEESEKLRKKVKTITINLLTKGPRGSRLIIPTAA